MTQPLPCRAPDEARYQPLMLLLAATAGGTLVSRVVSLMPLAWWLAASILLAIWSAAHARSAERAASWLLLAALFAAAGAWHSDRWRLFGEGELGRSAHEDSRPICLEAVALSSPRLVPAPPPTALRVIPKGDESQLIVWVTAVRDGQTWRSASGRALLAVDGILTGVKAGDRVRIMALSQRPLPPLNPGEFDYAAFERSRRVLVRLRGPFPESVEVLAPGSRWQARRLLSYFRDAGMARLRGAISPRRATLASAILLGAREQLDPERNESYLVTGTIHILSISGLHVGILAVGFWLIYRTGILPRRLSLLLAMAATGLYAVLTDFEPPVVRAAILVSTLCIARLVSRPMLGFNSLAFAGLAVLVYNPASLFLAGTQLSFLAVATMIYFQRLLMTQPIVDPLDRLIAQTRPWPVRGSRWLGRRIWHAWLTGALIWLVSLPLVWLHYGLISPSALILNLLISIPIALALYFGFAVLLLGWLMPPVAGWCGAACDGLLQLMEWGIEAAAQAPGSYFWTAPPPAWLVAALYAALAAAAVFPRLRPSRLWCWAAVATWLACAWVLAVPPRGVAAAVTRPPLLCTFVAVGHGTAAIIELPGGQTILYDCGRLGSPNYTSRQIAGVLWSRGITHLDAVIVSHADADHFNALPGLLDRFSVGVIYVSPVMFERPQPAVAELRLAMESRGIPLRILRGSDRLAAGGETRIEVLHPPLRGVYGSDNANSIVLLVEHEGRRLLLPGDLESPGLEDVLAEEPIDCDVIMAPHHGSPRSDPTGFALWSRPEFVVVSGGRDVEPRSSVEGVKDAYRARGATVLHTADDGAVRIEISRQAVRATTHRPQ